ncbi:3-phenylpropionate/cinnamic acid dioxygenase small subunit [Mycolicibacterium iranicum]|uniref:3-phenylpropionate/cinnamic acid dioxygenase small subunit n=1 Tax=Mycolicibacterium iranicum TaxID=912594 RepID=A0A839QBX6_MYCIR|nr:nuclear transport factor 2 family protein [Mycolicibacterium iranicum]MBB2990021.1 3-phenylpropionate/cinnamic acid dioxygenase small subunit [Mycolicibacterium iranicum]
MSDVETLGDELEIDHLLTRYCRAVDSKDWALYRSMFTEDARVDYSAAGLFAGGCDDAVVYLNRHQRSISVGMHYVTNVECRIDGDTATAVAMWFNAVRLPGAEGISFFHGRWHDRMVRTPSGWRISDLRLELVA